MCHNFLQLNKNKTGVVVFGAKVERLRASAPPEPLAEDQNSRQESWCSFRL